MAHDDVVQLKVRGLGRATITLGSTVLVPGQGMLFPLALILAQRAGEWVTRSELIALLWPESEEAAARHSFRQALYRLRKAGLVLDDRSDDVRVSRERVDSDVTAMLQHDWPFHASAAEIELASSVLPGVAPATESALAEWLDQLRSQLSRPYREATLHRIALARREGRWREADHWALMCLQSDPLNEEATLARAEALAMVGAKNAALEILDAYSREIGERSRVIGLPARLLRRRISELTDTTGRRITATSAPFIGRHEQLARAQDALAQARAGEATVQWFVGPPGIGKSRLMRELARAARMAGWCVVAGGARPSYEERPFALLTELLPHLLEAPGALGADPSALTLMRQMGRADTGEEPLAPEEARGRQYAVYLAWVELMDAVLAETPLAIIVDDANWSDPLTLLNLARFLESRPTAKLAVILSARRVPTREDGAAQRLLGAAQERVTPLSDDEMRQFTRALGMGPDGQFEEVTQRLAAVSGGNPLFLGHLLHQHQTHRTPTTMPLDLATLIDEQMRTLSRDALRLLQACALLGRHATLPRVERVLGAEASALVSPFGELDDLLALPSEPGQPLTPHDLWTERVRHGMTAGVFRTMAVSAARVLEADAESDGGIEIYWDAARLYGESGEKQLAYGTMMRCAEYLMRSGANLESCRAFATAATFAGTPAARYNALSGQLAGLHSMGEFASAITVIDELRALFTEHPQFPLTAEQEVLAIECAHFNGSSDDSVKALQRLSEDESLSAECRLHAIGAGLMTADNFHITSAWHQFSRALLSFNQENSDVRYYLRARTVDLTLEGRFDEACDAADELLLASRRRANRTALQTDLRLCSVPRRRGGDLERALVLLDEAQVVAKRSGLAYGQFRAAVMKAGTLLDYHRLEDARVALDEATELISEGLGSFTRESLNLTWAFWYLSAEDFSRARQAAGTALKLDWTSRSRHAMLAAALNLRIACEDRSQPEAARLLHHLLDTNGEVLQFGGSDQIAVSLYLALRQLHDRAKASEFARSYVTEKRKERFPPPSILST